MSNNIGHSFPSSGANPPEFHRGRASNRGEQIAGDAQETRFKGGGPRPEGGPERVLDPPPHGVERGAHNDGDTAELKFKGGGPRPGGGPEHSRFGGGDDRPEFFRGGGPRPVQEPPPHSVDRFHGEGPAPILEPPPHGVERFSGALAEYESRETVSLEVKTDDGDTVSISFEALNRIQAGVYSARADGGGASAQTVSAESSIQVAVKVEGSLDEEETRQISELLQRLVTTARSDEPAAIQTRGLESLDGFQFAYDAYRRAGLATLNARFD